MLILCHNPSKPIWSHYKSWSHALSNISIVQTFLFILSTQLKSLSKFSSSSIVISYFVKDSLSSLLGTGNITAKCYFSYVTYLWSFLYWSPLFFLFTDMSSHGPLLWFLFLVAHHPVITDSFLGMPHTRRKMDLCALFHFFHIAPLRWGRSYPPLQKTVLQILPSPQGRWHICQPSHVIRWEYCSYHFKWINRSSDFRLFSRSDHHELPRNRERFCFTQDARGGFCWQMTCTV